MFVDHYTMEKLMELEKRRAIRISPHELPPRPRRANVLARSVGRAIRRAGEGLEAWAGPSAQPRSEYSPEARRY